MPLIFVRRSLEGGGRNYPKGGKKGFRLSKIFVLTDDRKRHRVPNHIMTEMDDNWAEFRAGQTLDDVQTPNKF